MKLKKNIIKLVFFALVISLSAGIVSAGEDKTTITGVVEQTDVGFIIKTADGEFAAEGADLANWVGKTIEATGQVTEGDTGKVFNVIAIKEVRE